MYSLLCDSISPLYPLWLYSTCIQQFLWEPLPSTRPERCDRGYSSSWPADVKKRLAELPNIQAIKQEADVWSRTSIKQNDDDIYWDTVTIVDPSPNIKHHPLFLDLNLGEFSSQLWVKSRHFQASSGAPDINRVSTK